MKTRHEDTKINVRQSTIICIDRLIIYWHSCRCVNVCTRAVYDDSFKWRKWFLNLNLPDLRNHPEWTDRRSGRWRKFRLNQDRRGSSRRIRQFCCEWVSYRIIRCDLSRCRLIWMNYRCRRQGRKRLLPVLRWWRRRVTPAQFEFFLPQVKSVIYFNFFKKIAEDLSDLLAKFQKFWPDRKNPINRQTFNRN